MSITSSSSHSHSSPGSFAGGGPHVLHPNVDQIRLQIALDSAMIGIHEWDIQTGEVFWDKRCREYWGIAEETKVTYSLFLSAFLPEEQEEVHRQFIQLFDPKSSQGFNLLRRVVSLNSGIVRWIEITGRLIKEDGGRRVIGTAIDRTREQNNNALLDEANQHLAARNRELSSLNEHLQSAKRVLEEQKQQLSKVNKELIRAHKLAKIGVWTWNQSTNVIVCTGEFSGEYAIDDELNYAMPQQFEGEQIHPDDLPLVRLRMERRVLPKVDDSSFEYRTILPSGEIRYLYSEFGERVVDETGKVISISGITQDITGIRSNELELLKKQKEYESLFLNSPSGIFVVDVARDGAMRIVAQNPYLRRLTSIPAVFINDRTLNELLETEHKQLASHYIKQFTRIIEAGRRQTFEEDLLVDGQLYQLKTSIQPIADENGRIYRLIGINMDVRETRKVHAQLVRAKEVAEASERHYRQLFNTTVASNVVFDSKGYYKFQNKVSQIYSGGDATGKYIGEIIGAEKGKEFVERIELAIATSESCSYEVGYDFPAGKRWLHSNMIPLTDADGGSRTVQVVSSDITMLKNREAELKKAKEEAEENLRKYKMLFDAPGVAHSIVNVNGLFLAQNQSSVELFGGTAIGQTAEEVFGHALGHLIEERISHVLKTGKPKLFEGELTLPVGTKFVRSYYQPLYLYDNNLNAVQIVSLDMTEKHKAELNLIAAKEKAEESDRLKSAFLRNISHEIRTPVNHLSGFAQLMTLTDNSDDEIASYTEAIQQSSDQLLAIITNIVDIAMIHSKQVEMNITRFNLQNLAEELKRKFTDQFDQKGVGFNLKLVVDGAQKSHIRADQSKLYTVLNHLIDNSLKFTREGSVEVVLCLEGTQLNVTVKDTGIGIPAELCEQVFEPFRQADLAMNRSYEGNGLGISISKGFVELMNGEITLKSVENVGTEVLITLPVELSLA